MSNDERTAEMKKSAEDATELLVRLTNSYGSDKAVAEGILAGIQKSHNTLQQCFWRVMQNVIKGYGESEYCDLRNQASVDFCKAITKIADDHRLPMV